MKTKILGAGLAGLSCSYHIGHEKCRIFEQCASSMGHAGGYEKFGVDWDYGPHVSFTKNNYVRELFGSAVAGKLKEHDARIANYFYGEWLEHPVQFHLGQLREPLKSTSYQNFTENHERDDSRAPANYREWLLQSFGQVITDEFFERYTKKYWTMSTDKLATDWIGPRVQKATIAEVKEGFFAKAAARTNYINRIRYPTSGGFRSFLKSLASNADINLNHQVTHIDLSAKVMFFKNGHEEKYDRLISTIPLPELVKLSDAPEEVRRASDRLACTSVVLVNVVVPNAITPPHHWFYVYDSEMISSRVSFMPNFALQATAQNRGALQVEVYHSKAEPLAMSSEQLEATVIAELKKIGVIDQVETVHSVDQRWGNVVFDMEREKAQEKILSWLESFGLARETDDLLPTTDWLDEAKQAPLGSLILAGRFAQWKYFWTDDCVLRGRDIGRHMDSQ